MSRWTPCKRRVFLRKLRALGFEGPYAGSSHQFLIYRHHRLAIPSTPEYSVPQLRMMLQEVAGIVGRQISLEEWLRL